MFTNDDLIFGLALPFAVAFVILALLGNRRGGVALALGTAFIAGYAMLAYKWEGKVVWPPASAEEWLIVLAGGATVVGMIVAGQSAWDGAAWLGRIILAVAVLNLVVAPYIAHSMGVLDAFRWAQAILAVWLLVWWSTDELAERVPGVTMPLVMAATVGAAAALPILGGSMKLGKFGLMLVAALLAAALVTSFRRSLTLATGGMAVVFTLLGALLLCALFSLDSIHRASVLAVALAPLLAWARVTRPFSTLPRWLSPVATVFMVLIPLAAAVSPLVLKLMKAG